MMSLHLACALVLHLYAVLHIFLNMHEVEQMVFFPDRKNCIVSPELIFASEFVAVDNYN
jgi:hypothetical protein